MSEKRSLESASWRFEEHEDGVGTLWFDSPGRSHNVLDRAAFDDLDRRLDEIEAGSTVRGLIVRSAKERGFCAGADLKTIHECSNSVDLTSYLRRGLEVIDRLAGLRVPTTAVVHGVCLGGGLELALACRCRVAIASDEPLQVGCPEVRHGLIPAWGGIVRLPRLLAARDALNLLLTGNPLGFLQAKSHRLVRRLVTREEADKIAETLQLEPIAEQPLTGDHWKGELEFAGVRMADQPADFPEAQEAILDLIRLDLHSGPQAAREAAIDRCVERALDPSTQEAITSFFNRRHHPS